MVSSGLLPVHSDRIVQDLHLVPYYQTVTVCTAMYSDLPTEYITALDQCQQISK